MSVYLRPDLEQTLIFTRRANWLNAIHSGRVLGVALTDHFPRPKSLSLMLGTPRDLSSSLPLACAATFTGMFPTYVKIFAPRGVRLNIPPECHKRLRPVRRTDSEWRDLAILATSNGPSILPQRSGLTISDLLFPVGAMAVFFLLIGLTRMRQRNPVGH